MADMSLQEHSPVYQTRTIIYITQKWANVSQLVAFLSATLDLCVPDT